MSVKSRQAKIFAALLLSMTTVSLLLMALGVNPPSAGAFCLDNYYALEPVEQAISSQAAQYRGRWDRIEVCYDPAESGGIEQPASPDSSHRPSAGNFHFRIYSGTGRKDGYIETSERWQRQWSVDPRSGERETFTRPDRSNDRTIRVCIVAEPGCSPPTDYQIRRVDALIEALCRTFEIAPECVHYPPGWR